MTPYIVIDASVALKWVFDDEEGSAEAVALRDAAIRLGSVLIAPSLWIYEIVNGIVTAVRRNRLALADAEMAADLLMRLGIHFADPSHRSILDESLRYGIAAYDSAYLALAVALDAPLWTGDRPFFLKVRGTAGHVHWIGDYVL